jgi:CrcB protein
MEPLRDMQGAGDAAPRTQELMPAPAWTTSPLQDSGLVAIAAVGAALGAVVRVLLCDWCAQRLSRVWLGVVAVNVVGSAAAGVTAVTLQSGSFWWAAIGVGLLGGLTTMSAVGFEAVALLAERRRAQAAAMLSLNLVICPCAAWAGMRVVGA